MFHKQNWTVSTVCISWPMSEARSLFWRAFGITSVCLTLGVLTSMMYSLVCEGLVHLIFGAAIFVQAKLPVRGRGFTSPASRSLRPFCSRRCRHDGRPTTRFRLGLLDSPSSRFASSSTARKLTSTVSVCLDRGRAARRQICSRTTTTAVKQQPVRSDYTCNC